MINLLIVLAGLLLLGLSVALPPLLLLLFHLIRLPWGALATWVYLLLSLLVILGIGVRA